MLYDTRICLTRCITYPDCVCAQLEARKRLEERVRALEVQMASRVSRLEGFQKGFSEGVIRRLEEIERRLDEMNGLEGRG